MATLDRGDPEDIQYGSPEVTAEQLDAMLTVQRRHLADAQHTMATVRTCLADAWAVMKQTDDELALSGERYPDAYRVGYAIGAIKNALRALGETAEPAGSGWPTIEEVRDMP